MTTRALEGSTTDLRPQLPAQVLSDDEDAFEKVQDAAHQSLRKAHSDVAPTLIGATHLKRSYTTLTPTKRIRLSPNEQSMVDIQRRAAGDHEIAASRLPVEPPVRDGFPLELSGSIFTTVGGKPPVNEDRALHFSTNLGEFSAVIDGHGIIDKKRIAEGKLQLGEEIAELIACSIKVDLPRFISEYNFNTKIAFERWSEFIQSKLPTVIAGATVIVCFYEKITRLLHAATVGDSKAFVLRRDNGLIFPIPLSPDMSWNNPEAIARVKTLLPTDEFDKWASVLSIKQRRFPPGKGINTSASMGDKMMVLGGQTAITHLPLCALIQLKEEDKVFLCSDGVTDYATIDDLVDTVFAPNWDKVGFNFAQEVGEFALRKNSKDNITAVVWTASRMEFEGTAGLATQELD